MSFQILENARQKARAEMLTAIHRYMIAVCDAKDTRMTSEISGLPGMVQKAIDEADLGDPLGQIDDLALEILEEQQEAYVERFKDSDEPEFEWPEFFVGGAKWTI